MLALQILSFPDANRIAVQTLPDALAASVASSIGSDVGRNIPKLTGELRIVGEMHYDLPILGARKIIFTRGSKLILDLQRDRRPTFYIFADIIQVEDPNNPGLIIWNPPSGESGQRVDQSAQRSWYQPAFPGRPGGAGGNAAEDGRQGASGPDGNPGTYGPTINIVVRDIMGMPDIILRGQPGTRGGIGQPGGEGGAGTPGASAAQNAFNCIRGPGSGGPGGRGGNGGKGGDGGSGGDGGTVIVITTRPSWSPDKLRVDASGGIGGAGGPGAPGGPGGLGGPPGAEQLPWCRGGGDKGPDGQRGVDGHDGEKGADGSPGKASFGFIESPQIDTLLKEGKY